MTRAKHAHVINILENMNPCGKNTTLTTIIDYFKKKVKNSKGLNFLNH
jgi:hypothetical protein